MGAPTCPRDHRNKSFGGFYADFVWISSEFTGPHRFASYSGSREPFLMILDVLESYDYALEDSGEAKCPEMSGKCRDSGNVEGKCPEMSGNRSRTGLQQNSDFKILSG